MADFSTDVYKQFYDANFTNVKLGKECVDSNPCSELNSVFEEINSTLTNLKGIQWTEGYEDTTGVEFLGFVNAEITAISQVQAALTSTFAPSETEYQNAYTNLENLKTSIGEFDTLIENKPKEEDYTKQVYDPTLNDGRGGYRDSTDRSAYQAALSTWETDCTNKNTTCSTYMENVETALTALEGYNGQTVEYDAAALIALTGASGTVLFDPSMEEFFRSQGDFHEGNWWNGGAINKTGCSLVGAAGCFSMLFGEYLSPKDLNELAKSWWKHDGSSKGLCKAESPSQYENIEAYCEYFGIDHTRISSRDQAQMDATLELVSQGAGIIEFRQDRSTSTGKGTTWYTGGGHYFDCVGAEKRDGEWYVHLKDPNGHKRDGWRPYSEVKHYLCTDVSGIYMEAPAPGRTLSDCRADWQSQGYDI